MMFAGPMSHLICFDRSSRGRADRRPQTYPKRSSLSARTFRGLVRELGRAVNFVAGRGVAPRQFRTEALSYRVVVRPIAWPPGARGSARPPGSRPVGDPIPVEAKGYAHGKFNDR